MSVEGREVTKERGRGVQPQEIQPNLQYRGQQLVKVNKYNCSPWFWLEQCPGVYMETESWTSV